MKTANHLFRVAVAPIAIVSIWHIVSKALSSQLLFPGPLEVLAAFRATYPEILLHALATLARALSGFVIGSILGLLAGVCMSWGRLFYAWINPVVESLRPVPAIAAIPFFILWFGPGDGGQVLLISLSCATVFAVDVFHAIRSVAPLLLRAAQSLGASRFIIYRTIILPAILPSLSGGIRVVSALAFTIAVASEFMGAQWGLGFLMMRARRSLETQTILLGMLLVGLLARSIDLVIQKLVDRRIRWSESSAYTLQRNYEQGESNE
jgi:ABC-type nitrate/sulfonate/bicarbonate transport system permease component